MIYQHSLSAGLWVRKMPTSKAEISELMTSMANKYFDLVWYARKGDYDDLEYWAGVPQDIRKQAYKKMMDTEKAYPAETSEISDTDPNHSNCAHAFNSGMLAALRYVATLEREGAEKAAEEFPDLDT